MKPTPSDQATKKFSISQIMLLLLGPRFRLYIGIICRMTSRNGANKKCPLAIKKVINVWASSSMLGSVVGFLAQILLG